MNKSESLQKVIDDLPKELYDALIQASSQNVIGIVENIHESEQKLRTTNNRAKKKEFIKILKSQLNFIFPPALKIKNEIAETIKKDLLLYKKAYEEEAKNVNTIIKSANELNSQLNEPLQKIKNIFTDYVKKLKSDLKNLSEPIKRIEYEIIPIKDENNRGEICEKKNEYIDEAKNYWSEINKINEQLSNEIFSFSESFDALGNSVKIFKGEIEEGIKAFENSTPFFEKLEDTDRIAEGMKSIIIPLTKITKLIKESKITPPNSTFKFSKKTMEDICDQLIKKVNDINQKINEARKKIDLESKNFGSLAITGPNIDDIEKNINNIKSDIQKTNSKNNEIMEKLKDKTSIYVNQSRLDILFIIDCTNSINTYLEDIKKNFSNMITDILKNCPTATIYTGFIGYTDFSDLEDGSQYTDIDFTEGSTKVEEEIKNLTSSGGGDICEDLAGAFELALQKKWEGFSKFAILATDAPCHGKEYHATDVEDNYPDGNFPKERKDIKLLIKEFAEKNISLFCAKFDESTEKMYDIFKEEYEKGKPQNSPCQFTTEECKDLCEIIVNKAIKIYQKRKDDNVNEKEGV